MQFNPFATNAQQQQFNIQQQQQQHQQHQMLLFQQQQMQLQQQQEQQHAQQHDDEEMEEDAEMTEISKSNESNIGNLSSMSVSVPVQTTVHSSSGHVFGQLNGAKGAPSPVKVKQQSGHPTRRLHHKQLPTEEDDDPDDSEYDEDDEDDDEDDLDELDEQMMHQMIVNASPDSQNVIKLIISGYNACASETLRYLIEEENLPAHSPTMIGLIQHLKMQETMLIMSCLRTQQFQQQLIAQQQQLLQQQQVAAQTPAGQMSSTTTHLPQNAQQMHLLQQQQQQLQQQQALIEQQRRLNAAAMNLPSPPHSHGSQSPHSGSSSPLLRLTQSPPTLSPLSSGQSSPDRLGSPPTQHPASNHVLVGQPLSNSPLQGEPFGSNQSHHQHQSSPLQSSSSSLTSSPPSSSFPTTASSLPNFGSTSNSFGNGFRPSTTNNTSGSLSPNHHPFGHNGVLSSFNRPVFSSDSR